MAKKPVANKRYAHVDGMRAVAVMLVVVGHAGLGDIVPGGSGVTIFFGISGFIISYLLLRERDSTNGFAVGSFYLRRVLKIGPPLLLWVVIPSLIIAVYRPINWSPLVGIVFFYYNWFKTVGIDPPLAGAGVVWSLSIEEQFYLGVALIWLCAAQLAKPVRWLTAAAAVAAVGSLVARIALATSSTSVASVENRIYYGSDTRLDAIALGVLTAVAFNHSMKTPGRARTFVTLCSRDLVLVGATSLYLASLLIRDEWFRYTLRFSFQSVAVCLAILYGFGASDTLIRRSFNALVGLRAVQVIGLASYSIYLTHLTVIDATTPLIGSLPVSLRIVVLIVAGTVFGVFAYYAVEVPVLRLKNRWSAASPPGVAAQPERPDLDAGRLRDDAR